MVSKTEQHQGEKTKHVNGRGRGGARRGAGRPKENSAMIHFRAPEQMANIIKSQPNQTDFIKDCINRRLKLEQEGLSALGEVIPAGDINDIEVPIFDISLVAGFPVPLDNDEKAQKIGLMKMLIPHEECTYLIHVKGNSMIDANIHDGDIVIVDKSNRNPTEKQVAVCELNGEYTLKRFIKRGDEGWLVPANPNFPEIKVTPDDDFSIWGTVTYVIHKPDL